MDICELRNRLFGRGVTEAAITLDAEGVWEVEEQHQRDWDDGVSYAGSSLFTGNMREEDTEREAYAVAEHLQFDLETIIHDHWLSSLSRDEVIALCRTMNAAQITVPPVFTLCQGASYTADQIVFDWNEIFPIMPIAPEEIHRA